MGKKKLKKKKRFFRKYINGTKGVISLFLAILMLPFTMIAGVLINAARINSAAAIFDEALCNASNSTLGTYDEFLKDRFGLLAISQEISGDNPTSISYTSSDFISETFSFFLEENAKSLSNTYTNIEYDVEGVYSLSDTDVLLSQVLEYSKYSVPTKLVEDNLSLDKIISSFEEGLPGSSFFSFLTSTGETANKIKDLGTSFTDLKNSISAENAAIENYNNTYNAFSQSVSDYLTKKQEMNSVLSGLETTVRSKETEQENIVSEISKLEQEIGDLEKKLVEQEDGEIKDDEKSDISQQLEEKQIKLSELEENKQTVGRELSSVNTDYSSKKQSYEAQLATLQQAVLTSKNNYSSAISTLIEKMNAVKSNIEKVQSGITDIGTSVVNTSVALKKGISSECSDYLDENIDVLKKQKDKLGEDDSESTDVIQNQIDNLNDAKTGLSYYEKVIDAQKEGYSTAVNTAKDKITDFDTSIYTTATNNLNTLKKLVQSYDEKAITKNISSSEYYVVFYGRMTYEAAKQAEESIVGELTKSSVWALIKSVFAFFKALFSVTGICDPQLCAVIDDDYYQTIYGGLPSEKDRDIYPLNYGEEGDAELSEYYKQLFGDYSSDDASILGNYDVISALSNIFNSLEVINSNVSAITHIYGLFDVGIRLEKISDAAKNIVNNIKGIINYLANAISGSAVANKILLSGYVSYMTSNRTTYEGSALNGTSFNLRGQESVANTGFVGIDSFIALINYFQKTTSPGGDKCFVGAETEYIIWGSSSELSNQCAAFASIYVIRVLADIVKILSDPEVASIAAASTIGAPIVYLIYILIEPLIETILLVNGNSLPFIKNVVYLTPTGLNALVSKFGGLMTKDLDTAKINLAKAFEADEYADAMKAFGTSENTSDKSFFQVDYSKTLLLIMSIFTSRDKMLQRLSNIIEMEAVQNLNGKNSDAGKLFDLDYSYTYLRAEASFSSNEFITISDGAGFKSEKRIIYKGY